MHVHDYLAAARVPATLRPQRRGLWRIRRVRYAAPYLIDQIGYRSQTRLERWTMGTLHQKHGVLVMDDSHTELSRHLPIWLHAWGNILVTGLGLGCVVRGLLANPKVEHVDVVEIDKDILAMVGPDFASQERVTLHHGDALTFPLPSRLTWDYAWHDLFCKEGHLQILHARVLLRYQDVCRHQGAWGFPRCFKRTWAAPLVGGPRRMHEREV